MACSNTVLKVGLCGLTRVLNSSTDMVVADSDMVLPAIGAVSRWFSNNYLPSRQRKGLALFTCLRNVGVKDDGVKLSAFRGKTKLMSNVQAFISACGAAGVCPVTVKAAQAALTAFRTCLRSVSGGPVVSDTDSEALAAQQHEKVEQVINDVLATLPKGVAHNMRVKLARSDNKLYTLSQLMQTKR